MKPNRHRPNQLISGIDGIPFVHVAIVFSFVVLVIFLTLPIPVHGGIRPILARVGHPVSMAHANREDAMIVTIFRDDKVFYRSDLVRSSELPAKIRQSLNQGAEREVTSGPTLGRGAAGLLKFSMVYILRELRKLASWSSKAQVQSQIPNRATGIRNSPHAIIRIRLNVFTSRLISDFLRGRIHNSENQRNPVLVL
jgi:biopolymer transport protein ExbD